jgi:predicted Zn-dependent protease
MTRTAHTLAAWASLAALTAFVLISVDLEKRIGRESQAAAERQMPRVADPVVTTYVRDLGTALARHAGGPDFAYSFHVADARSLNAFALPGGPVWVHRGALAAARSEAEVAGILAHEIAHIAERHAAEQISAQLVTSLGLSLLSALLGNNFGAATTEVAAEALASGVVLKFSRDDEREADAAGAAMMTRAGWDARGLVGFLEVLRAAARRDPSSVEVFFSTHPAPDDRIAALKATLKRPSGTPRDTGRRRRRAPPHEAVRTYASGGHSQAAPRTPLESPCIGGTSRVATVSEKTNWFSQRGTAS